MIYIINQYATDTSRGRLFVATQNKKKTWNEYLDLVHQIACSQYDDETSEYFLNQEYNLIANLTHINQWEELAETNKGINYYDSSDDSYMRIEFIERRK